MNGIKRYGALLLALSLALSLTLSASSAVHANSFGALPEADNGESIITLHKYVLKEGVDYDKLKVGDGKEVGNTDKVYDVGGAGEKDWITMNNDGDVTPQGGVEFWIKKKDPSTTSGYVESAWAATSHNTTLTIRNSTGGTPLAYTWDSTEFAYKGTKTGTEGMLIFENLAYGQYDFVETQLNGYGPLFTTPMTVSVPTQLYESPATGQGNIIQEWIYDIHVYPKNQNQGEVTKKVLPPAPPTVTDDPSLGANVGRGNQYKFEIEIELPKAAIVDAYSDPQNIKTFYINIEDPLDGRLIFDAPAVVEYASSKGGTTTPIPAANYILTPPDAANKNVLTIRFANDASGVPAGMQDLYTRVNAPGNDNPYLYITINTHTNPSNTNPTTTNTIGNPGKSNPDDDTEDPRDVNVSWPQNPGGTTVPPGPGNRTGVGDIEIIKQDAATGNARLNGAKFMLFRSKAAADAYDAHDATTTNTETWLASNAVPNPANSASSDLKTRYTFGPTALDTGSGENGLLYIRDVNAWSETLDASGAPTGSILYSYWLVEVEAPTSADGIGYNLLTDPVEVKWNSINAADKVKSLPINNNKGFLLPKTGGTGTLIFTIVGLSLITIAGVALILHLRRKNHDTEA